VTSAAVHKLNAGGAETTRGKPEAATTIKNAMAGAATRIGFGLCLIGGGPMRGRQGVWIAENIS